MTERKEALVRQLYLRPECPTVDQVWQEWRSLGESATTIEIRQTVWSLEISLYTFRHYDLDSLNPEIAHRLDKLYDLETKLIVAWQAMNAAKLKLPFAEDKLTQALSAIQRRLSETIQNPGGIA